MMSKHLSAVLMMFGLRLINEVNSGWSFKKTFVKKTDFDIIKSFSNIDSLMECVGMSKATKIHNLFYDEASRICNVGYFVFYKFQDFPGPQYVSTYKPTNVMCPYRGPNEWKIMDPSYNKCYQFNEEHSTWLEAKTVCNSRGAILWEPKSQAELHDVHELTIDEGIWMGITDQYSHNTYVYESSKEHIIFSDWDVTNPSNTPFGGAIENCVETGPASAFYKWNDLICNLDDINHKRPYVCEALALIPE